MTAARTAAAAVALFATWCTACADARELEPDYGSCARNSDCTLVPESCCGSCGAPSRGDALAINASLRDRYRAHVCGSDMSCPACAPLFIDPTLIATCRAGRCELVDLQQSALSECGQDSDCRVRAPDCCECGGDTAPGRLIGLPSASESGYAALVCDADRACPECAPIYPSEVTATCNAEGHCEMHDARLP